MQSYKKFKAIIIAFKITKIINLYIIIEKYLLFKICIIIHSKTKLIN